MNISTKEILELPDTETYKTKYPKLRNKRSISVPNNSLSAAAGDAFKLVLESMYINSEMLKKKANTPHVPWGMIVVTCCNAKITTASRTEYINSRTKNFDGFKSSKQA